VPRDLRANESQKRSSARRAHALARLDLREPTVPRANAVGAFSHAVKVMDAETQRLISEALAARGIAGIRT
jgi:hypothetical protein